jgi:hypothetical protein
MDSVFIKDMEHKVKTLMSPDDEETWRRVGLFDKVDKLQKGPLGTASISNKVIHSIGHFCNPSHLTLQNPSSLEPILPPSNDIWASTQSTFMHPGPSNFSSSQQGHREPHAQVQSASFRQKLWKANKKAKRLVLGNDVGLEDTYRMALCSLIGRVSYNL